MAGLKTAPHVCQSSDDEKCHFVGFERCKHGSSLVFWSCASSVKPEAHVVFDDMPLPWAVGGDWV